MVTHLSISQFPSHSGNVLSSTMEEKTVSPAGAETLKMSSWIEQSRAVLSPWARADLSSRRRDSHEGCLTAVLYHNWTVCTE